MRYKMLFVSLILALLLVSCASAVEINPESSQELAESGAEPLVESVKVAMLIAPDLTDCTGEGPQKCMQIKFDPDEEWQFFYDQIEGFEFEEGYRYVLLVEKLEVKDPPADASSLQYVLVDVVEKEKAVDMDAFEFEDTPWVLTGFGLFDDLKGVLEKIRITFKYDTASGQVLGSGGCNRYFGEIEVDQDEKRIKVGFLGLTRMACQESVNQQETAFISILEKVTRYDVENGKMILTTDDGQMLVFEVETTP